MSRTKSNIYKRKDGRWEARYPAGKTIYGQTKYKSVYGKTYGEVKKRVEVIRQTSVAHSNRKILFSAVLDFWMTANSLNHKDSTKMKYEYMIEIHIKPSLGGYDIREINNSTINEFLSEKLISGRRNKKGGLSNSYVRTLAVIIQSALNYAVKQGLRDESITNIIKPAMEKKEIYVLSCTAQSRLEAAIADDPSAEALGIMIALNTGLRIGEICALRWEDIDLENQVIHIRHTISRIKNNNANVAVKSMLILDRPKTKQSFRDIPITTRMFPILISAKDNAASEYVVSKSNSFVSPRSFEYKYHKKLKEIGIEQINFHALRHTFATRCIEKGVDVKTLSEILGHSNVGITLNTYVHSSMDLKRKQLEKLNL